jgi:ParB-like chromosome segregation protein Spo0J
MKITNVPIDAISAHPQNVRQGDIGAIVQSLEAHGQYRPLIVQKSTGFILAGNHTWRAAAVAGLKKVDIVELDVDNDEALRILLVDNRTNDLATYDDDALKQLLELLAQTDRQLDGTGFDLDDLDDLLNVLKHEDEKELNTDSQMGGLLYRIVIDCANEFEQQALLSQFDEQGLNAKALVS